MRTCIGLVKWCVHTRRQQFEAEEEEIKQEDGCKEKEPQRELDYRNAAKPSSSTNKASAMLTWHHSQRIATTPHQFNSIRVRVRVMYG